MAQEIERKFLVINDNWRKNIVSFADMRQGYMLTAGCVVRIRITADKSFLTIKGPPVGISRAEYEYEIPLSDAEEMLQNLCHGGHVEKRRYQVQVGNDLWVVDEFHGRNHGLVLAEIELQDARQTVSFPDWLGEEVSDVQAYSNASLARTPYNQQQ